MVLTRLSKDVRSLLLVLAVALSLLVIAPRVAQAGVNGCPHSSQGHYHGLTWHTYDYIKHENIRVEGIGWVHSHTYLDIVHGNAKTLYKLC
jgi:hypothetical protein